MFGWLSRYVSGSITLPPRLSPDDARDLLYPAACRRCVNDLRDLSAVLDVDTGRPFFSEEELVAFANEHRACKECGSRFKPHCSQCVFLGRYLDSDLYFCPRKRENPMVLAISDGEPSRVIFAMATQWQSVDAASHIGVARIRAALKGLVP